MKIFWLLVPLLLLFGFCFAQDLVRVAQIEIGLIDPYKLVYEDTLQPFLGSYNSDGTVTLIENIRELWIIHCYEPMYSLNLADNFAIKLPPYSFTDQEEKELLKEIYIGVHNFLIDDSGMLRGGRNASAVIENAGGGYVDVSVYLFSDPARSKWPLWNGTPMITNCGG